MTSDDRWVSVMRPAGTSIKDDPNVRSEKTRYSIRYSHLKVLYGELGDLLKASAKYRTVPNRKLYSAMGLALRQEAGKMGGAPRSSAPRCPCGEMTAYRAKVRYHYCTADGPVPAPRDLMRVRRAKARRESRETT